MKKKGTKKGKKVQEEIHKTPVPVSEKSIVQRLPPPTIASNNDAKNQGGGVSKNIRSEISRGREGKRQMEREEELAALEVVHEAALEITKAGWKFHQDSNPKARLEGSPTEKEVVVFSQPPQG